jgi:hypothetical protein
MAIVLEVMNPRISLDIKKAESGALECAIMCVSKNGGGLDLTFLPSAKTHLGKPVEWDEIQKKINDGLPPKPNHDNQVSIFYGTKGKNSCGAEIRFYDGTSIRIEDKEILGLPSEG